MGKPSYDRLTNFGCLCHAHSHSKPGDKFDARAIRSISLMYFQGEKDWVLYDLGHTQYITSTDVQFRGRSSPILKHPPTHLSIMEVHSPTTYRTKWIINLGLILVITL